MFPRDELVVIICDAEGHVDVGVEVGVRASEGEKVMARITLSHV
jgi:hypothetical protein